MNWIDLVQVWAGGPHAALSGLQTFCKIDTTLKISDF